jgi:hypothetical protein
MQYSQAQPVDFGKIAMGFAQVSENKRLEAERKQQEREDFQVKMTETYGETIYSPFDNTGLANIDIANQKIKDSIVGQSNIINKLFEEGRLSKPEVARRINLLKSQTSQYNNFVNGISGAVEEYKKLGGNASESSKLIMEKANQLFQNTAPGVDTESMLKFYTKDGEVLQETPFMELQGMLDIRAGVNEKEIVNEIIGFEKNANKLFENGTVYNKFLETGELQEEHKSLLFNYAKSQDDKDLYDLASKAGIKVELDPSKLLSITNREDVEKGVQEYLGELTKSSLNIKDWKDDVAGLDMSLKMKENYRREKKFNQGSGDAAKYNLATVEDKTGLNRGSGVQAIPKSGSIKLSALPEATLKAIGAQAIPGLPQATVNYYTEYDGASYVNVSYKESVINQNNEEVFQPINREFYIPDLETENLIRTRIGMQAINASETTNTSAQQNTNTKKEIKGF